MTADKNILTAVKLGVISIAMFGFGYALVPLYDVICEYTGLNGKTGVISLAEVANLAIDSSRLVTVEFDTNVNSRLPWEFTAEQRTMQVHPGQVYEAIFVARNLSDRSITGQAIPSVAPGKASLYLNKTECFCFLQQTLGPGETKRMPVRFVVDTEIPGKIHRVTLSYTFFSIAGPVVTKQTTGADQVPNS